MIQLMTFASKDQEAFSRIDLFDDFAILNFIICREEDLISLYYLL